ncbi:hypothetical protein [Sphingomonas sp.]|uniref:hypothetical protein n=1 Tax=Sphingomonas sp. TaxID=28214 RepID=UPI00286A9241|nr:hypothetical protein [Sphingomonas sp.]
MATMTSDRIDGARVLRFGLAGGIAAALVFVGLWAAAQLPIGPSDLIVNLFTTRGPASTDGLQEGVLYAALLGFFCGATVDLVYEGLRWIENR